MNGYYKGNQKWNGTRMHSSRMLTARSLPSEGSLSGGASLTQTPLERDPYPWTETPLHCHVTYDACWDRDPSHPR